MIFGKNYAYHQTEDRIEIYLLGGDGWFLYTLRRLTLPFQDGGTYQNQDLWRLYELYLCEREGNAFHKIYEFPLVNQGEWECAIAIEGKPDFHGGFHGYEHFTGFQFFPEEDRLEFVQDSVLYLQGTRDDLIAYHRKKYCFQGDTLTLEQQVDWKKDLTVRIAYLAMLPIRRREGDFSISDRAYYQGEEFDVRREGHMTRLSPGCRESVREVSISGEDSGVTASVKVDFDNRFFIQNVEVYNKLYFVYAENEPVSDGTHWETTTIYRFYYNKK